MDKDPARWLVNEVNESARCRVSNADAEQRSLARDLSRAYQALKVSPA
jgi:hypothetical protein